MPPHRWSLACLQAPPQAVLCSCSMSGYIWTMWFVMLVTWRLGPYSAAQQASECRHRFPKCLLPCGAERNDEGEFRCFAPGKCWVAACSPSAPKLETEDPQINWLARLGKLASFRFKWQTQGRESSKKTPCQPLTAIGMHSHLDTHTFPTCEHVLCVVMCTTHVYSLKNMLTVGLHVIIQACFLTHLPLEIVSCFRLVLNLLCNWGWPWISHPFTYTWVMGLHHHTHFMLCWGLVHARLN